MEYASAFLSAASSLSGRSTLSSTYTLATASSSASAASSSSSSSFASSSSKTLQIGPWKVERASHNSSGKQVSIWSCDQSSLVAPSGALKRDTHAARRLDKAIDILKKEAAFLSRLRHPCILEMAEPVEETRSIITFATEPVTACLRQAIAASASASSDSRHSRRSSDRANGSSSARPEDLELDEVEIQKGLSQLTKGLQFLHDSAKTTHGNLTPEAVVINAKGDWKLSGFGLSIPLFGPDGAPTKWEFPEYDHGLPASIQRNFDYIAPEYILDESNPTPANDMYSLGCILHSIHTHAGPPFHNRQSLSNARTNIEEGLSRGMVRPQWRRLPEEAQSALSQLVTRYPNQRLTATAFLAHGYFSSLLVSTLNFIARDAFASQSTEAQTSFLKGLLTVLPQFSDKVNRKKVLPSLLEETRKPSLVPFLLPNIACIAQRMDSDAFQSEVLPHLTPLFRLKDPPQAIHALLDSLTLFNEKCTPAAFRDEVMPLVYLSLESDNPLVLEKALTVVPGLCETLDYTTVKQTLFPKITAVFSKTTMLRVKINALLCFHSMTTTLDKFTLTEKLVPLLAKIKTKEPAVMLATLEVCSRIGDKVDIEAIATLILPQLWGWSMGPLLSADQFAKFMSVIKRLGTRVETKHTKALQDLKRLEESTSSGSSSRGGGVSGGAPVDFETLVRGGAGLGKATEVAPDIFGDDSPRSITPSHGFIPPPSTIAPFSITAPSRPSPRSSLSGGASLGARPVPASTFNASAFAPAITPQAPLSIAFNSMSISTPPAPLTNALPPLSNFAALEPARSSPNPNTTTLQGQTNRAYASGKPNYDTAESVSSASSVFSSTSSSIPWNAPSASARTPMTNVATAPPPPTQQQWNVLQPKVMQQPKKPTVQDFGAWSDFDPLK